MTEILNKLGYTDVEKLTDDEVKEMWGSKVKRWKDLSQLKRELKKALTEVVDECKTIQELIQMFAVHSECSHYCGISVVVLNVFPLNIADLTHIAWYVSDEDDEPNVEAIIL